MVFNNLKIKTILYRKALKKYSESNYKNKHYSNFKTGYYNGFNDCLKWIIRIFKVDNVGELKKLTGDKK